MNAESSTYRRDEVRPFFYIPYVRVQCDLCPDEMTQNHCVLCPGRMIDREGLDMNDLDDLVKYFSNILDKRRQ